MDNAPQNKLQLFVEKLRYHLNSVKAPIAENGYLDLGKSKAITEELLHTDNSFPYNPLAEAYQLIVVALNERNLDKVKLGVNEILKTYLKIISDDNQETVTHEFIERIKLIFRFSLLQSFPYSNFLWLYICRSVQTVATYLLEKSYTSACKIFLEYIADMGKTAAKEGLRTDILQHFLVMFEINASEKGFEDLAGEAKNHRHNLET